MAESFYISAALAVASVPQGIRAAYFISGAAAMERSLRAGAAICSYQTLERLASVGTLCIEKTGVLTEGYVSVSSLAVLSKTGFTEYEYSEAESRLTSGNSADGFYAWEDSSLSRILICAAVCNNAKRVRTDKQISGRNRGRRTYYDGDPLESALLRLCSSCGIERELLICEKLSERAFDRSDRYMTVTVREQHGRQLVYAKGAPEVISSLCSLSEGLQNGLDMLCEKYASSGMRLLAFCMNRGSGWELLGLAAFRDSIRPHSAKKVRRLRQLGISAVMLTGDHPLTAAAAASRAGILTPDSLAVTGDELDTMNDEQLYDNVRRIALASRTVPEQRERILSTLKSRGVVCAYAGDAPPESADVRISSADKTADIILSGGISSIAEAAAESRASLQSLLRTVCCMISAETALLLTAVSAAALGMSPIFKSTHLLIAALLCGSLPVLTLSAAPLTHSKGSEFREKIETLFGGNIADAVVRGVLSALCVLGCCSLMMSHGAA
ncbi:MAG: cation-transporting P-type ATPase, partial [Ruminococcus sp.]|nr:cation-transporting P-type ATPase [Ruminococcus sp.]